MISPLDGLVVVGLAFFALYVDWRVNLKGK
jgi:hypothetical protein